MSKEANKEASIRQLYGELNKHGLDGDYDKALKAANRILGFSTEETKAIQCKVVCLIQVSKFNEALQFIDRQKLSNFAFEKGYCEYRLNQPDIALKTVENCGINPLTPALKELKAQILYRLEKYEECFDSYRDLIKNTDDDYDEERTTNLSAVAANLAIEGSKKEVPALREDTYELTYNSVCGLVGNEKYAEAEKKLRLSEKMCREFLEQDSTSEEDIQDEIAIIKVQLAYCLQMQGKVKEASVIYADVLKNKAKDPALVAVASNNSVTINKDQNVFDSKKKMRAAMADSCEHKLTIRQKKIISLNNCLLTLYTNQAEQCHQLCTRFAQSYPESEFPTILIRVSQFAKDKKYKEGIELLEKFGKANPSEKLATKFAIVQLLLLNSNKKQAIEVLQSLDDSKYRPGVVSALVTLLIGSDNKTAASQVLKDAVDWYKKNKSGSAADLSDMWRQAADFHLRGGEPETAASSLEELLKRNSQDMKILAQLVIAYAQFNPKKALEASKKLPALETMTTVSEIDSLEATNWMMSKSVKKTTNKLEQSPGTPGSELIQKQKTKRLRKRKGKLPKNYDLSAGPDPERWLPKYERTGFRKKRDRRNKDVIKGSQGMSSTAADQFDMTRASNLQTKNSPATTQEAAPGPRQQQRKHQQKKKNKGGRH